MPPRRPRPSTAKPTHSLQHLIEEIATERRANDWSIAHAEAVYDQVHDDGAIIDPSDVRKLLGLVAAKADADLLEYLVPALMIHAVRHDDGTIIDALAQHGGEAALLLCVATNLPVPMRPSALDALLRATKGLGDPVQKQLLRFLGRAVLSGIDLAPARARILAALGSPARGRGSKRVALGEEAVSCIAEAMTQDDASAAFRPELERIAKGANAAAHDARKVLVEVAKAKGGSARVDVPVASAPDAAALIAQLLAAPPKKQSAIEYEILALLRTDPSVAARLPKLSKVPADGPIPSFASLHVMAILLHGNAAALQRHFDDVRRVGGGLRLSTALSTLANAGGGARFAKVVAPYLEDDDPNNRWWAAYFFRQLAARDGVELAPFAEALLRRVTDGVRPKGRAETVSGEGRNAVRAALAKTAHRDRFVKSARTLLSATDPKTQKALRAQLRELLPEALATLPLSRRSRP